MSHMATFLAALLGILAIMLISPLWNSTVGGFSPSFAIKP
jgi:hypothetical protein